MRFRATLLLSFAIALVAVPSPAHGQRVIDLTADMLERWLDAKDKENQETKKVQAQLTESETKITKFEQCKRDFEAAGSVGGRMGGLMARAAIKKKCGASDAGDMQKERQRIMEGPETAAADAGKFKLDEYRNMKEKIQNWLGGDESGFTKPGLDLLKGKRSAIASVLGVSANVAQASGSGSGRSGGRGIRGPNMYSGDNAWIWISQLFTIQYLSGAAMFETNYKPGEWTKWSITTEDNDEQQQTEKAFLGKTAEGAEWWRFKTITSYKDDDRTVADTVVLESLFKPEPGNDQMQRLVRMRGKFPGQAEAQEMMVPEQWGMWNLNGSMGMKPTKESVEGATVGIETITTPAGTFKAKHVRFGQGGGSIDWWLDETAIGGWVKFSATDNEKKPQYTMQMIGKGTGAKSELGINVTGGGAASASAASATRPATSGAAPASIPAADASAVSAENAITADRLDRFVRGLNSMNAMYAKDSIADAKLPPPASEAAIEKFKSCENDYFTAVGGPGEKLNDEASQAPEGAKRSAAEARALAGLKAKCGAVPSGYPAHSPWPHIHGWKDPTEGRSERYKAAALSASGLDERLFAMLVERVNAFLQLEQNPTSGAASYVFTAAELTVLRPRTATLRKATVHTDVAW